MLAPSAVHDNGELPHHDQRAPGHEPHAWATARHAHALYGGPSHPHPHYHGTATAHAAHGKYKLYLRCFFFNNNVCFVEYNLFHLF